MRKEELREGRKLWKKNHLAVHLLRILPLGGQPHHQRIIEGIGPHRLEGIGVDHKPHRVNRILITEHQSKRQTIEPRFVAGDRIHRRLQPRPQLGLEVIKIVKNFMKGGRRQCRIAMRVSPRGIRSGVNVKFDMRNREVKRVQMSCHEVAEGILR